MPGLTPRTRHGKRNLGISMKIEGVKVTLLELARWHGDVKKTISALVRQDIEQVAAIARSGRFQDRSGKLRRSIRTGYKGNRLTGYIEVGKNPRAPYAQYVEFGPSSGRRKGSKYFAFLYPAFDPVNKRFPGKVRRKVRQTLKRAGARYRAKRAS